MIQASTIRARSTNQCSDFDILRWRDASCSRSIAFELSTHSRNTCSAEKRSTSVDPRKIDILRIFYTNGSFRSRWKTYDPSHECMTFQPDPVVAFSPRNAPWVKFSSLSLFYTWPCRVKFLVTIRTTQRHHSQSSFHCIRDDSLHDWHLLVAYDKRIELKWLERTSSLSRHWWLHWFSLWQ